MGVRIFQEIIFMAPIPPIAILASRPATSRTRQLAAVFVTLTALISMLLGSLVGCDRSQPAARETGHRTTLRMMVWSGGGEDSFALEKRILDEFERLNPDVKLEIIYAPYDNYIEKLLTLAVGRELPDVFWIPQESVTFLANRGVLMDVTERAGAELDTGLYFPAALDLVRYKGRLMGLPRDVCCYFFVYNRDQFREAGLPFPTRDWTWKDFRETGLKLQRLDDKGAPTRYAYVWYPYDFIYQNGGYILDDTYLKSGLGDPECYEALQWFADDIHTYRIAPPGHVREALGDGMFTSGHATMSPAGPWMIGVYAEQCKFDWGIVPMPAGKAGPKARLLGLPVSIAKDTEHPEEAWRLLKFLCYSEEAQRMQAKIGVAMPARRDIANGPDFRGQSIMPPGIDDFLWTMDNNVVAENTSPTYGAIRRIVDIMVDEALLGRISAKEAAESAQRDVERTIEKASIRGLIP